ncbi:MAG: hypothetical protein IKL18_05810 [Oscillospiraceae bacterium]|nr:hypothetical protein [Oscillospiraceae bacterium]
MKIIFLDIDGVLNSDSWNQKHENEIKNGILVDEEKVKILSKLIKTTGAKIVLHSGWRFWFDDSFLPIRKESEILMKLLNKNNIHFYDFTPDLTTEEIRKSKNFSKVKPNEILLWLKKHSDISSWVVIDDLDLNNKIISDHQIKPDSKIGLSSSDIEKAVKLLE